MLELVSLVECKDATTTVLFVTVVAALTMLFVITLVLWLLEMVLELVDLRWKDPDFFFRCEEGTLPVAMSSLQRGG